MFSFVENLKLFIMEANELRIGNYVDFIGISKILELHSQEKQFDNVYLECEESFEWCEYEKLKPLHLTNEIILKCGFEKGEMDLLNIKISDVYILELMRVGSEYCTYHTNKSTDASHSFKRIKYLHQLQNLYFALTNTELTVNL